METQNIAPTCKALVQEGPRKGETCKFPPLENAYCGRHERNKIYDDGISEGKKWCRFFFRGCSNTVEKGLTCNACINKKYVGKQICKHEGCSHHTIDTDYCKKHERDIYYIEEKEKGFKYCDISRGCFNLCNGDKKSCDECLQTFRIQDKERFDKRKELHTALHKVNSIVRICVDCGNDFDMYKTFQNNESKRCKQCNQNQHNQDIKRNEIRSINRNQKEEMFKNKERYYKSYINCAIKRDYEFKLNFEEFCNLVEQKCFYCHHHVLTETNGIDRVDNSKGYTRENTVSCCEKCNRIKHAYHPLFFLEKCKIIGNSETPDKEFYIKWKDYYLRTSFIIYSIYKKQVLEERGLTFDITESQWDILTRQNCYLCGYKQMNGIGLDRVDNSIRGYTFVNVRPCCGSCNNMKNEIDLETFINHCKKINEVWKNTDFFKDILIINKECKTLQIKAENRKVWKALGLYYTILNNEESQFLEANKEVLKEKELQELCIQVKKDPKENALIYLSKFLRNLKDRRKRLAAKPNPNKPAPPQNTTPFHA